MNASLSTFRTTRPEAILSVSAILALTGRILMAAPFLISGLSKLLNYANVGVAMSTAGIPSALLPPAIAFEVFGACALIIGWRTRTVAGLLACFCAFAALFLHHDLSEQGQMLMFLKDFAIAGGLLVVVASPPTIASHETQTTATLELKTRLLWRRD